MHPLAAKWNQVEKLLLEVRDCLPAEALAIESSSAKQIPVGDLKQFDEFLEHNELELAWNELAAIAERHRVGTSCWRKLAQAAKLMELPDKEETALNRATLTQQSSDENG